MKALWIIMTMCCMLFAVAFVVLVFSSFWAGNWGTGGALFCSGLFAGVLAGASGTFAVFLWDEHVSRKR